MQRFLGTIAIVLLLFCSAPPAAESNDLELRWGESPHGTALFVCNASSQSVWLFWNTLQTHNRHQSEYDFCKSYIKRRGEWAETLARSFAYKTYAQYGDKIIWLELKPGEIREIHFLNVLYKTAEVKVVFLYRSAADGPDHETTLYSDSSRMLKPHSQDAQATEQYQYTSLLVRNALASEDNKLLFYIRELNAHLLLPRGLPDPGRHDRLFETIQEQRSITKPLWPLLTELLSHKEASFRMEAVPFLCASMGYDAATGPVMKSIRGRQLGPDERRLIINHLQCSRADDGLLDFMLGVLRENERDSAEWAVRYLSFQENTKALEALYGLLDDQRFQIKHNAIQSMGRFKYSKAFDKLMLLADGAGFNPPPKDWHPDNARLIRADALDALGLLGNPGAVPLLEKLLSDESQALCASNAAGALCAIGSPEAYAVLYNGLFVEHANAACIKGWAAATDPKAAAAFVAQYFKRPADKRAAYTILDRFFGSQGMPVQEVKDQTQALSFFCSLPELDELKKMCEDRAGRDGSTSLSLLGNVLARVCIVRARGDHGSTSYVFYARQDGQWQRIVSAP